MAKILNIETSSQACSVALSIDRKSVFNKIDAEGRNHSELLGVFVDEVMTWAEANGHQPDAVAVSAGPGSYTGLRIGVSLAKGLCFGLNIPLIAIETLSIMAYTAIQNLKDEHAIYCPMLDARRMEVYSALYSPKLELIRKTEAEVIDETSFKEILQETTVYFFGDGADKCKEVIQDSNAKFIANINPLATEMGTLAEAAFAKRNFVDVAYFEPHYLKEFLVTTSKKDVLGLSNHRKPKK